MDDIDQEEDLPLISIALCTYNGGKYLEMQLQSILSQTYPNLEVVIVDDRSTDETEDLILQYLKIDKRIKFFKNPNNIGFNKNFERAISLTTGEYIAISDQDDIWKKEKIEILYKNIGNNWVIFSNSELINEKEESLGKRLIEEVDLSKLSYRSFLYRNYVTGHNTFFHRAFLDYYLPIPEQGYYDWWMGFIAAYHRKLFFLDSVLTQHRVHSQSVVQQSILAHEDIQSARKLNYDVVSQHLSNFRKYKFLEKKDRLFLQEYEKAYSKSLDRFSFNLYWFYLWNFDEIHLERPNKSFLSKANFLRKISGPVNQ